MQNITASDADVTQAIQAVSMIVLIELIRSKGSAVYCGYDPTASSLHVGNLLSLLALRHFQLRLPFDSFRQSK